MTAGVSFVVPVHNGAAHLAETIAAVAAQADGRPMEIIAVEDGSSDDSAAVLRVLARTYPIVVLRGPGRGAAAAVNTGIRRASHSIVCQVDQDVVTEPGWMAALVDALRDPDVGAAQGCYVTDRRASFFARVMSLDLAHRYARMGVDTDHICTGNAAYRAEALRAVGLLDESLGYGYDNDLSYRLQTAGYRLVFRREAHSRHRWRDGFTGYVVQQYGFGYGRLEVVSKHRRRWTGDAVSPAAMMAHPCVFGVAMCVLAMAATPWVSGSGASALLAAGGVLLLALIVERLVAGVRAWKAFGDPAGLAFPLVHLVRDAVWIAAVATWVGRRLLGRPRAPAHSMTGRPAAT